ncbi:SET and MYND domain-containing protein 4-like isoform X2 [Periplaneta americana]|uniref:SET and MYND domain-containing protein 4-like isoform X2 n=1 Tax=Periplaneta americana TaxID=6978 RepID=UPI0037E6FD60
MLPQTWQELLDYLTTKLKQSESNILSKLSAKKSQEDCVRICLYEQTHMEILLEWMKYTLNRSDYEKSSLKASEFRTQGNSVFRKQDITGSLALYTKSVIHAPPKSEELSLALANRSAALFHLEEYKDCLQNITLALENGYPEPLRYKLYMRRSQCLSKLRRYKEEIEALQSAQQCLDNVEDSSVSKKTTLEKEIELALARASSQLKVCTTSNDSTQNEEFKIPIPTHGKNEKLLYASAALDLRCNEEKGRHVVTNREVKMGDILFVEKPYAFVVLPDQYKVHCHHCCGPYIAPVPCWGCTQGLYCSDACRQQSWDQYHQWECRSGMKLLHCTGIAHLGLRVVLQAGPLSRLKDSYAELRDSAVQIEDKYGDNYKAVYQLMPHLEDMQAEDLFQYTMTACMLTLYLCYYTDYFKMEDPALSPSQMLEEQKSVVCLVGGLILRHIAQLVCNAHAITKLDRAQPDREDQQVVTESQVRVATAIYPTASMMNHSCDPSIINSFYNQFLIVRACKDIPKGGEVFNCYGPHFRHMGLQDRQEILKSQYFFTCSCGPCSLQRQHDFQERFSALQCSECRGPLLRMEESDHKMMCADCGHCQGFTRFVGAVFRADALFNEGNYGKSVDCLLECLPAVEEQFGAHSIELANELQKLTDVMISELQELTLASADYSEKLKKATECVQRAKLILELHYGIWNTGLQDILSKEQILRQLAK